MLDDELAGPTLTPISSQKDTKEPLILTNVNKWGIFASGYPAISNNR